ncbi:unnamed protein product, partial [Nesidiocoris tenuis]
MPEGLHSQSFEVFLPNNPQPGQDLPFLSEDSTLCVTSCLEQYVLLTRSWRPPE